MPLYILSSSQSIDTTLFENEVDPSWALRRFRSLPKSSERRIVWVGDSTVSQPFAITYTAGTHLIDPGVATGSYVDQILGKVISDPWYGVRHLNRSMNGQTLSNFINNNISGGNVSDIASDDPHLIIFSFGINDVRLGATSKVQLKANLQTAIAMLTSACPNADILLRMPNTLGYDSTNTPVYIDAPVSQSKVQSYSTILKESYRELALPDHVYMMDTQGGTFNLFGETVKTTAQNGNLLGDAIHPSNSAHQVLFHYQAAVTSGDLSLLSKGIDIPNIKPSLGNFSEQKCSNAFVISSTEPHKYYPRICENPKYYNKLVDGLYDGTSGTNIVISKNTNSIEIRNYCGIFQNTDIVLQYGVTATSGGLLGEYIEDNCAAWQAAFAGKNEAGNHTQFYSLWGGYPLAAPAGKPIGVYRLRPSTQINNYDPDFSALFSEEDFTAQTVKYRVPRFGVAAVLTGVSKTAPSTGGTIDIKKNGSTFATLTWANGATVPTYSGAFFTTNTRGMFFDEGDIISFVVSAGFVGGTYPKIVLSNH